MIQSIKIASFIEKGRFSSGWVLSLLVMVACAAPAAPAQETKKPSENARTQIDKPQQQEKPKQQIEIPQKALEKSRKQIEAEEILAKAAKVQGGKEIARKLKSFTAEFQTEYFNKDQGRVYYEVKRCFQFPLCLWTEKKHEIQDQATIEVFDGEDGWLISPEGDLIVYTDNPSTYKTDMENLEHDVRLTKQMFKYFFIANLGNEITNLERLGDNSVFEGGAKMLLVSGRTRAWISGDQERTVYLKVFVDPKSYFVRAVEMIDLEAGTRRRFVFTKYKKNSQGIQVPGNVKMYTNYEPEPEMTLMMMADKGEKGEIIPKITFNEKLDPALFVIPEEDE